MKNKKIKYEVITAIEEDLAVMGIYDTKELAYAAMEADFLKVAECDGEDLNEWLSETDSAFIDELQARILDECAADHCNHDWLIVPLVCDGQCRVATDEDIDCLIGTC